MHWNKYYTSPSHSATFIFGELCYYKPILVTQEITGVHDSYVSYVSRKEGVLSEHTRYSEDQRKGNFGHDYFLNKDNFNHYFTTTLSIIKATDDYKKLIEGKDVNEFTSSEILDLVLRAEPIYNKSMGYYFLSQPEYTAKLKEEFLGQLKKGVPENLVYEVFTKLVESGDKSCLEEERDAWLTNIIIPSINKTLNPEEIEKRIEKHVASYKYLSASAQFGLWDTKHYKKLFADDSSKKLEDLKEEIVTIESKKERVEKEKKHLKEEYKIEQSLIDDIQILANLGWLRLEAHMRGWQFFQWFGAVLVKQAAKATNIDEVDIFNLKFSEFVKFLNQELTISDEIITRRKGDVLVIVTPEKGEEIYFAKDATEKYDAEIAEKIEHSNELNGQTANGKGLVRGRAFVFKWGEDGIEKRIYEFPDGDIIVAGQTLPLFMPAIRKCLAIVTNEGGVLCHAAIVSRELNKPAIIGTKFATTLIKTGDIIELDLDNQKVRIVESTK